MGVGILIGYFAQQDQARKALRKLSEHGFHRAALASRDADGTVHTGSLFIQRLPVKVALAVCLFGVIAGFAPFTLLVLKLFPLWSASTSRGVIAAGAAIGLVRKKMNRDRLHESVPRLRSLLILGMALCMIIQGPLPLPANDTIVQPPR